MMTHDRQDSVFAWFTGMIGQVVGMITMEGVLLPLVMAFGGGLLGYLGKEAGSRLVKKFFSSKTKRAATEE